MCNIYLVYYENENYFVDLETDQILFEIYNVITPSDLFLFRHDPDKFCKFPWVMDRHVTVHIIFVPIGEICSDYVGYLKMVETNDLKDDYDRYEKYERTRMANIAG